MDALFLPESSTHPPTLPQSVSREKPLLLIVAGQERNVCLLSRQNSLFTLTSLLVTGAWLTVDFEK